MLAINAAQRLNATRRALLCLSNSQLVPHASLTKQSDSNLVSINSFVVFFRMVWNKFGRTNVFKCLFPSFFKTCLFGVIRRNHIVIYYFIIKSKRKFSSTLISLNNTYARGGLAKVSSRRV
jgi:hypothetical protein